MCRSRKRLQKRFALVALIDSDAWFGPSAPPLDALVEDRDSTGPASVYFASDAPFGAGPNCGFMVWRATADAERLLRFWWHLDAGPYATQHDYEQRTLYWAVAHLDRYRDNGTALRTLRHVRPMVLHGAAAAALAHADHTRRGERLWRLSLAVLASDAALHLPSTAAAEWVLQSDEVRRERPDVQALQHALWLLLRCDRERLRL